MVLGDEKGTGTAALIPGSSYPTETCLETLDSNSWLQYDNGKVTPDDSSPSLDTISRLG
jgi:hypothetical protein